MNLFEIIKSTSKELYKQKKKEKPDKKKRTYAVEPLVESGASLPQSLHDLEHVLLPLHALHVLVGALRQALQRLQVVLGAVRQIDILQVGARVL